MTVVKRMSSARDSDKIGTLTVSAPLFTKVSSFNITFAVRVTLGKRGSGVLRSDRIATDILTSCPCLKTPGSVAKTFAKRSLSVLIWRQ